MFGQKELAADLNRFFVSSAPDLRRKQIIERMHWQEETAQDMEQMLDYLRPWTSNAPGHTRGIARLLLERTERHLERLRLSMGADDA